MNKQIRELLEQSIDALLLPSMKTQHMLIQRDKAIIALRRELEQPEQELVAPKCGAIIEVFDKNWRLEYLSLPVGKHKLYTQQYTYTAAPAAQRPWQGLTDTEIDYQAKTWRTWRSRLNMTSTTRAKNAKDDHGVYFALGALWAEAKLKERNGY